MEVKSRFSYRGGRDKEGWFKGEGEIIIEGLLDPADELQEEVERVSNGESLRIADEKEVCVLDNRYMGIASVRGKFKKGKSIYR